jgi:hypothetical protein
MQSLAHQKCFHHYSREAVARCPECTRFFCRECVVEHDDRILCSSCLAKLAKANIRTPINLRWVTTAFSIILGLMMAWLWFYVLGRGLLHIPSEFHDGSFWENLSGMM